MATRLNEIRARVAAATKGPWRHIPGDSYCAYSSVICGDKTIVFQDHHDTCCEDKHSECCGFPDDGTDARLIANCPEDLAWLIAELDAANTELAKHHDVPRLQVVEDENAKLRAELDAACEALKEISEETTPKGFASKVDQSIAIETLARLGRGGV